MEIMTFVTAAGADRQACAGAVPPRSGSRQGEMTRETKNTQGETAGNIHLLGPTEFDAMQDGAAFVSAVASRVDLVRASVRLVCANDEKIAKAELDRLREMKFGKVSATTVPESPTVIWDVPGLNVLRNES